MEGLLEDFFSVSVTSVPNAVVKPHPRYSEFKRRSKEDSQELRRKELLQEQKRLRSVSFDANRDLEAAFTKTRKPLRSIVKDKYKLMLSEWLVDIPCDMTTKWKMLLCPEGRHVLVIAIHGKTKVMDRRRQELRSFNSVLPGGSPECPHELSVLDCIWSAREKTLYVLDMLCWAHHDIVDCEAEFRFFWLQCKFKENPEMTDKNLNQGYKFVFLETHVCEPAQIEAAMSHFPPFPDGPKLDGILFYHMEASYMMGQVTPLVGWLKGYMIPDLLQIPVAAQYMASRPCGLTLQDHINVEEKLMSSKRINWKRKKANKNSNKMECDKGDDNGGMLEEEVMDQPEEVMVEEVVLQSCKTADVNTNVEPVMSSESMTT